jgi:hypothetical protein
LHLSFGSSSKAAAQRSKRFRVLGIILEEISYRYLPEGTQGASEVVATGGLQKLFVDSTSVESAPLLFVVPEQRQRPAWSQILLYVPKIFFLVEKLNCGSGDEGCRKNVEFGPLACRCQRCWTGAKGLQVDISGLRADLWINHGWSGEKINLNLRELCMSGIRYMQNLPESA